MGRDAEAVVHQVVVEAGPASAEAERLRAISEEWATDCAEERSLEPLGT
jgi:hypothetical protein